jgi:NTE family protein
MKILTASGGGSLGAYSVGLLSSKNKDYDVVIGISTSALMAVLVALKKWSKLIEAYTSVTQRSIFSYNPFKTNGSISFSKAVWRLMLGKKTLGETLNLKKLIDKFLTLEDWDELQASGKEVIVVVQKLNGDCKIEYISSKKASFEEFKTAMWRSANAPLVTTMDEDELYQYVDGGLTELVSIKKAIELGASEIDVVVHRTKGRATKLKVKDFFHNVMRTIDILLWEIESNDLEKGLEFASLYNIPANVYYLPHKLTDNSLIFNKEQMLQWYELGRKEAING